MPTPSARALLADAVALDAAGREGDAIPIYRRALATGLPARLEHTALVGLGSSLRTTGNFPAAIRTLDRARQRFRGDPTIIMFLALAHHDAGQTPLAIRQLADMLLKQCRDRRLARYRKALARKFHALRR